MFSTTEPCSQEKTELTLYFWLWWLFCTFYSAFYNSISFTLFIERSAIWEKLFYVRIGNTENVGIVERERCTAFIMAFICEICVNTSLILLTLINVFRWTILQSYVKTFILRLFKNKTYFRNPDSIAICWANIWIRKAKVLNLRTLWVTAKLWRCVPRLSCLNTVSLCFSDTFYWSL